MKAYLRHDDVMLGRLRKLHKNSDERGSANWNRPQVTAKASIILHMGSQSQARTREIIGDDKKTAYNLWKALESTDTKMNTKAVHNLKPRLDVLLHYDGDDWDEHFSKFMANIS